MYKKLFIYLKYLKQSISDINYFDCLIIQVNNLYYELIE
jgi:hypothetical protein